MTCDTVNDTSNQVQLLSTTDIFPGCVRLKMCFHLQVNIWAVRTANGLIVLACKCALSPVHSMWKHHLLFVNCVCLFSITSEMSAIPRTATCRATKFYSKWPTSDIADESWEKDAQTTVLEWNGESAVHLPSKVSSQIEVNSCVSVDHLTIVHRVGCNCQSRNWRAKWPTGKSWQMQMTLSADTNSNACLKCKQVNRGDEVGRDNETKEDAAVREDDAQCSLIGTTL